MTNRIGGPIPPESPKGARGTPGVDKNTPKPLEGVEKVHETELDKQRKRAFKKAMDGEDDSEVKDSKPSPFQPEFHLKETLPPPPIGFEEFSDQADDTSEHMTSSQSAPREPYVESELPEAEEFWKRSDLPDQPPAPIHFKEKNQSRHSLEKKQKKPVDSAQEKLIKKQLAARESSLQNLKTKPSKEKKALSEDQLEEMSPTIPKVIEEPFASMPTKKTQDYSRSPSKASQKQAPLLPSQKEMVQPPKGSFKEKDEKKKGSEPATVSGQIPDPLPSSALAIAKAAQTSASPFINQETASLFFKMVGTIAYMTDAKPGISLTEVTLNSLNFKNSVFFNSTITIEKYATAPDSFNIRLTGAPEAVNYFRTNIDQLSAAFTVAYDERRIQFRIGRIETALAPDRPLIRRKGQGGDKEDLSER